MKHAQSWGRKIVQNLMQPINNSAVIIIAIYTILWGFWISNPFWEVFNQAPLYMRMSDAGPEWAWGSVAILTGLGMLYGVERPSCRSLTFGAFVGAVHWLVIAFFYFWGDWQNTGGITAMMISVYCTFVYLNVRLNNCESHPDGHGFGFLNKVRV